MGKPHHDERHKALPKRAVLVSDERGYALLFTVLTVSVLLLFAGLATDFARLWVAREDLRTAVDAAALAGSLEAQRYVTITVQDGYCETCCDEDSCWCCCVCNPSYSITGTERRLIDQGGWRRGTCCDGFYGIQRRWIEYPSSTGTVALQTLDMNWPRFMRPEAGGAMTSREVNWFQSGPRSPSVQVRASGTMDTTFLKIANIESLATAKCGQAATFYERIEGGYRLGRNPAPADACN